MRAASPRLRAFPRPRRTSRSRLPRSSSCRCLTVNDRKLAELAARLPSGRVHANGKGFIPAVRRDLYGKLLEASGQPSEQQSAPNNGGAGQPPGAKPTGNSKRPKTWQDIAAGHVVIIQEDDPRDGWWDAIVVAVTADMLSLRWRASPGQRRPIARHRFSVGLMYPDINLACSAAKLCTKEGQPTKGPAKRLPPQRRNQPTRVAGPRSLPIIWCWPVKMARLANGGRRSLSASKAMHLRCAGATTRICRRSCEIGKRSPCCIRADK